MPEQSPRGDQHSGCASSIAAWICDAAGWRQRASEMKLPENIVPRLLLFYAPEFNPMKNVWAIFAATNLPLASGTPTSRSWTPGTGSLSV